MSLITVAGFALTVYEHYKNKQYSSQLTCDVIDRVDMTSPKQFGKCQLSMSINGKRVDKRVSYVKFLLVSVGSRDIIFDPLDKISFELSKSGRWLSFDVYSSSLNVSAQTSFDGNVACLFTGKLLRNEAIVLEGAYESNEFEEFIIKHRLANTQVFQIKETFLYPSIAEKLENKYRYFSNLLLLLFFVFYSINELPIAPNYYVKNDGSTRVYVEAKLKDIDSVYVKEPGYAMGAPEPEILTYKEFAENYTKYSKLDVLIRNSYIAYYCMAFVVVCIICARNVTPIKRYIRRKRNRTKFDELILRTS